MGETSYRSTKKRKIHERKKPNKKFVYSAVTLIWNYYDTDREDNGSTLLLKVHLFFFLLCLSRETEELQK